MKILTFVDLHGSNVGLKKISVTAKAEKVDFIVCAGDITIFGNGLSSVIDKLDEIGIPVIITHGNHEDETVLKRLCSKSKNITFLHKTKLYAKDAVFMAYGGGGFSVRDSEFESWAKTAVSKSDLAKKIVLITHAPPYGNKLDMIMDQPAGSKSIRQFIKLVQPKLAISGHLHENSGAKDTIGKTRIVNPGPGGMILIV